MKKWDKNLKIYDELVGRNPKFPRKGKTMPYTSANGYMFSQLNKDGDIGIRLPKQLYLKFREEHKATEFRSYGAVIREYVKVPDELLTDLNLLSKYLDEAYEYVMTLKPK